MSKRHITSQPVNDKFSSTDVCVSPMVLTQMHIGRNESMVLYGTQEERFKFFENKVVLIQVR